MKKTIITLTLSISLNFGFCQINNTTSNKLTQELENIYSRDHITGFSVAIVDQKNILFTKGFGYSDIKKKLEYTENTIQNIASISKTFIGIALLKAQELNKLKLDDPINKYLSFQVTNPYFPNHEITIRQLATHTSSIKDASSYEKYGYILKERNNDGTKVNRNFRLPSEMLAQNTFLKQILSIDGKWYKKGSFLKNIPGEKFEYSNIAAGLAALVLENATGKSFSEFTNEYIFKPLTMSNTGWSFNEVNILKHSKLYASAETELAFYLLVNYPDGGLITSSSDLGKYLSELIAGFNGKGKILNKKSYDELFTPQLTEGHFEERNDSAYNDEYNMGIFMGISAQNQIGHTGGDPGVATHMFFNTKTGVGKILIVNTDLNKEGVKEFIDIWKKLEEYENELKNSR
ncbi:serine hydrolase domain-containing protein [Aquimarina mytili]|uniref:Beta-lactamase family protein n=1 Tax=Aquimarina mytili TaxID=874423 RepID=A0A937A1D6_9FLAO|nr:serine hydrolase domain-containing protein [Aquimarina mytili]MBL0685808.1 beta-lactamase family protein [Aquimarina mytili]